MAAVVMKCDICSGIDEVARRCLLLSPLLEKHLDKVVHKDVFSCNSCEQLLHLWDEFSREAKINLAVSHPEPVGANFETCHKLQDSSDHRTNSPINLPSVDAAGFLSYQIVPPDLEEQDRYLIPGQQPTTGHNEVTPFSLSQENDDIPGEQGNEWEAQAVLVTADVPQEDMLATEDDDFNYDEAASEDTENALSFGECNLDRCIAPSPPPEANVQDPLMLDMKPVFLAGQLCAQHSCTSCGKLFLFEKSLKLHRRTKHSSFEERKETRTVRKTRNCLLCPKCNCSLASKQLLISHLLEKCLEKNAGTWVCIFCRKCVSSQLALRYHLIQHFNAPENCTESFKSKERQHHSEPQLVLNKITLEANSQTKTDSKNTYPCSLCSKVFGTSNELKHHNLNCFVEKNLKCTLCKQEFSKQAYLLKHMKRHEDQISKFNFVRRHRMLQKNVDSNCQGVSDTISQSNDRSFTDEAANLDDTYKCDTCSKVYNCKKNLTLHIINKHKIRSMQTTSGNLLKTLSANSSVAGRQCKFCSKILCHESYLKSHISKVHSDVMSEKKFKSSCSYCSRKFNKVADYNNHLCIKHAKETQNKPNDNTAKECKICHKFFSNNANLKCHLQKQHLKSVYFKPPGRSVKHYKVCPLCNVLMLSTSYSKHKKRCNAIENKDCIKKYQCHVCAHTSETKRSLITHLKSHPNNKISIPTTSRHSNSMNLIQPKLFHCSFCIKIFAKKSSLNKHVCKKHPSQLLFECKVCFNKFSSQIGLSLHMLCHKDKAPILNVQQTDVDRSNKALGTNSVSCDVCHLLYSSSSNLKSHKRRMHSEHVSISTAKDRVPCNFCHKEVSSNYLQRHIRLNHDVIEGTKKLSSKQPTITRHVTDKHYTKRDENLYFCNFCMKSLPSLAAMTTHIKEDHLDSWGQ